MSCRTPRPGEGDEPRRLDETPDLGHLAVAPDEVCRLGGQVVGQSRVVQRAQREEVRLQTLAVELEDLLGPAQVLQAVVAEVPK